MESGNSHEQNNSVHDVARVAVQLALGEENEYVQRLLANKLEGRKKKYKATPIIELLSKPDRTNIKRNLTQAVNITQQKAIDTLCEQSNDSEYPQRKLCLKSTINIPKVQSDVQQPSTSATAQNPPHVIVDVGSFIASSDNAIDPQKKTEPDETNASSINMEPNKPNTSSVNTEPVIDLSNNQAVSSWVINTLLQEKLNYREVQEKAEKWKNINGILALILPLVSAVVTGLLEYYLTNGCDSNGSQ
jgi:hypothetical protein